MPYSLSTHSVYMLLDGIAVNLDRIAASPELTADKFFDIDHALCVVEQELTHISAWFEVYDRNGDCDRELLEQLDDRLHDLRVAYIEANNQRKA